MTNRIKDFLARNREDGPRLVVDLDVVREIAETADDYEVEKRLDLSDIVSGVFGTGDFIAYCEAKKRVTIVDLKYGRGVVVEADSPRVTGVPITVTTTGAELLPVRVASPV